MKNLIGIIVIICILNVGFIKGTKIPFDAPSITTTIATPTLELNQKTENITNAPKSGNPEPLTEASSDTTLPITAQPVPSTEQLPSTLTQSLITESSDDTTVKPEDTTTVKPENTTTVTPETTTLKPDNITTTSKTDNTTTVTPETTTVKPDNTTTISPTTTTTTPVPITTPVPTTTAAPPVPSKSQWSTTSFIGGMVFAFGIIAIGFISFKFYKARNERNYHTL